MPRVPDTAEQPQYDAVAESYDRLVRPRYESIAALVVRRVHELLEPTGSDVVELAAGTGALTHQLAPGTGTYRATDISPGMLAAGRGHAAPGCDHVEWRVADVTALDLPSASADLVACSLGPFQDSEEGRAESRRVLRTGGFLVATTWGDDYRELALLAEARRRLDLPPRPTTSAAALGDRLEDGGYREVAVRPARLPVVHDSVEAYLAYRASFGPVPDLRTSDEHALASTIAACAEQYLDDRGRVVLDWQVLVMSARA
jgi:SAM-dependent methyltransferase